MLLLTGCVSVWVRNEPETPISRVYAPPPTFARFLYRGESFGEVCPASFFLPAFLLLTAFLRFVVLCWDFFRSINIGWMNQLSALLGGVTRTATIISETPCRFLTFTREVRVALLCFLTQILSFPSVLVFIVAHGGCLCLCVWVAVVLNRHTR